MSAHAKSRPLPKVLLVLGLAASLVLVPAGSAVASDQFDDVPDDHPFHDEIGWMADREVTEGFEDGTFRPEGAVTRQAYLAFLHRLAGEPTWAGCDDTRFSDVDGTHQFCEAITWGAAMGITGGYDDGTFRPGGSVTRQAAAAFQYRAVGAPDHDHDADFSDVPEDHPFHHEIAWMEGEGITTGYEGGTVYRPARAVTRQAAAAFLFRQDEAGYTVDPAEASRLPEIEVTPADAGYLPEDGSRDHTADGSGVDEVTIELAVCANVATTDGQVAFDVDDTGDDDVAAFGDAAATISEVEVDGVPHPDAGTGEPITVDGGELTFNVDGGDEHECVAAVVFADEDGDGLDVQGQGLPTEDFGIAGATTFSDVTGVRVTPGSGGLSPHGGEHTVTAVLLGRDVDGDEEPDVLPLSDQEVQIQVRRYETGGDRDRECGGTVVLGGDVVVEASAEMDDDGRATFTYVGPSDPDPETDGDAAYDCIIATWNGTGDYAGQGPHDGLAAKGWTDGDPEPTNLDLAQDQDVATVDTDHTVTATVTDQFDEPVQDVVVRFDIERDDGSSYTFERTTDADGEAVLTYNGPSTEAEDTITATALDDEGEEIPGASDSVTVTWSANG